MQSRFVRPAFPVYLAVASLVLAEIGVRVWGYSERHIYDPIYMPFERSKDIPYIHKPNLQNARGRGLAIFNTDGLGLRSLVAGRTYGPRQPGQFRIAIVGDSGTFGEGVPDTNDTFPQVLERVLNERQQVRKVTVFNYGASAYNVKVMTATLLHRMLEIEPDLVVMSFIPDDLVLSRTPAVDEFGYLRDVPLGGSRLTAWAWPGLRRVRLLYPIRAAWELLFSPELERRERISRGELPETYEYVRQFAAIASTHDTPYLILIRPTTSRSIITRLTDELRRDRIRFADLAFVLDQIPSDLLAASRFDRHPSPAVHRRLGEELAGIVLREEPGASSPAP